MLFRSASACLPASVADAASVTGKGKGKERERADDAWGLEAATALLRQWAEDHKGDKPFTLAVVGVTNVSAFSTNEIDEHGDHNADMPNHHWSHRLARRPS